MNPMILRHLSLVGFQGLNAQIYLIQNDRNYDAADMVVRIGRYVAHVLKAVRKEHVGRIPRDLCMAFSWSMALGNRLHVDLENEMWKRFPGVCPYCASSPCLGTKCKLQNIEPQAISNPQILKPASLWEFQGMFARIYSRNTLRDAIEHLSEEVTEVHEALEEYMGTHNPKLFEKIVEELVDAITNMLAVATCLKLDLAFEMEKFFSQGCPECKLVPCKCGYVTNTLTARSTPILG